MKQIPVSLSELYNRRLPLGRVGENQHVQIVFQCNAIFADYPNATTLLIVTAPGGESYAPEIEKDGTNILWTVTDSDLAKEGGGELQLTFTNGQEIIKSYIGKTQIFRSIAENGEIPTPIDLWIERANETVRQAAQDAADATVDDLAEEKDSAIAEIQAQETATEEAIAQAAAAARASIPGEYRQLSDDVSGLKNALDKCLFDSVSEDVSWEIGTQDRSQNCNDGSLNNNSNTDVTKFVDISAYKFIRYMAFCSTASTTTTGIAFFSEKSQGTFISGVKAYEGASEITMAEQMAEIPSGAKYARFTVLKNYSGFFIKGYSSIDNEIDKVKEIAGIDRGVIADLGYTSLTQCIKNGFYRSGAAYVSSILDMPIDYSGGAFNLYVTYPSFAANTWIRQELTDTNGNYWSRILNYTSGSWSAYSDWVKLATDSTKVDKTVFDSSVNRKLNMSPFFNSNSYWDISNGETAVYTSFTGVWKASNPIDVKAGETYTYTANQGASHKIRLWVVTDDEYNIISMADDYYGGTVVTLTFTIPENGTKLLLMQYESTYRRLYKIESYANKPLNGLRLSLLGDSISSYSGHVPAGNDVYYNGTSNGIMNVAQMWWNVLCNETGMIPLVIDAWSGSSICYNYATDSAHSDTNKIPMCSDLRTGRLENGSETPDIIIVTGGTNDWTYSKSTTTPLGDWNGRTAIERSEVLSGNSTFAESYASLIAELQTNYPNAIIVCASLFFTDRGTDLGVTRINDMGYTESDYNDVIKKICEIMGVPYIDIYNVGFNHKNYYPTYAQDNSTIATHPNAKGHLVIAKRFIEELPKLVKQFTDVG